MTLLAGLGLAGCWSMAPKYERPASPVPTQLPGASGGEAKVAEIPWRAFVHEAKLQQIVEQALVRSRDLRKAVLNIEAARAQFRIQRAQQYPSIDATFAIASTRSVFPTGIGDQTATATETLYEAGVGITAWEIDLFGRLKSLSDAKQQQYLSTVETAAATRITLVAEVMGAYLTIAADKSRLAIAKDTVESSKRTMDLTEQLVTGGTANRADVWQAAVLYQQARGDVALLTATIAQDRNALELLAGGPLGDDLMPDELPAQLDWFSDVPVGLASSVLLDRPDVRAAEHDLMAANANIGEARARFFPSLTLTANGGIASTALGMLFSAPSTVFNLLPQLALPLFRGGANRANLALSETQKKILIASYELAIQTAFREVADALATRSTIAGQLEAQAALVDAATKAFELSQARYKAGVDTFLTTLVSERALYTAKSSLIATQLSALGNRVTLYRVLGGGLK
ncbi:MAG TPA: efflux transporter outer membrane subunit [Kofleriaceae bacterium]|nr:efflux transporter outer membrane subunit [Kofleriaceae bacterium]